MSRTSSVAVSAIMFELAISCGLSLMSLAMMSLSSGGNAYLYARLVGWWCFGGLAHAYHDKNAIMKPNQEKKNTRP